MFEQYECINSFSQYQEWSDGDTVVIEVCISGEVIQGKKMRRANEMYLFNGYDDLLHFLADENNSYFNYLLHQNSEIDDLSVTDNCVSFMMYSNNSKYKASDSLDFMISSTDKKIIKRLGKKIKKMKSNDGKVDREPNKLALSDRIEHIQYNHWKFTTPDKIYLITSTFFSEEYQSYNSKIIVGIVGSCFNDFNCTLKMKPKPSKRFDPCIGNIHKCESLTQFTEVINSYFDKNDVTITLEDDVFKVAGDEVDLTIDIMGDDKIQKKIKDILLS